MGSAKKSAAAPPSSEEKVPDSRFGGKRSSKAKRYTFDDDEGLPTQSQKPIASGQESEKKTKEKPDYDDLLQLLSTNAKAKQNVKAAPPSFDLPEFDVKTV